MKAKTLAMRFSDNIRKTETCWLWLGKVDEYGYGLIGHYPARNKKIRVHRLSWELHHGPIHEGLNVLHKCDNPPCVNPDHLFLGTQVDNVRDMDIKGRRVPPIGVRNGSARLTENCVRDMRVLRAEGWLYTALADFYGVSKAAAHKACVKTTWRHVV